MEKILEALLLVTIGIAFAMLVIAIARAIYEEWQERKAPEPAVASLPIFKVGDEVRWHSRGNGRTRYTGTVVSINGRTAVVKTDLGHVITRSTRQLSLA